MCTVCVGYMPLMLTNKEDSFNALSVGIYVRDACVCSVFCVGIHVFVDRTHIVVRILHTAHKSRVYLLITKTRTHTKYIFIDAHVPMTGCNL